MNKIKVFIAFTAIITLCAPFVWAGGIDVVEVNEERNAIIALTLCGDGSLIDDPNTVSDDDTFYILFSASEVGDEECVTTEEIIPVPVCGEYSKIVALLHSEITPIPEGDLYNDLLVDSLAVELDVNLEDCCQEKYDACAAKCDVGDTGCVEECESEKIICLEPPAEPEITVDCDPDTLNLKSNGNYLTCYLSSTYEQGVEDINQTKLELHYTDDRATTILPSLFSEIEEERLMVKFSRSDLIEAIDETKVPMEIELIVRGGQNVGDAFEATDTINVIKPPHFETELLGQSVTLTVADIDPSVVKSAIVFWGDRERTKVSVSELSKGVSHTYEHQRKHGYKIRIKVMDKSGFETNYSYDKNSNLEISID